MSHSDDFTVEWARRPDGYIDDLPDAFSDSAAYYLNGYIDDLRITRGVARYHMPRWQRWLMPWRNFKVWRKPTAPFPDA